MHSARPAIARSLFVALGLGGCNAILDNKPGEPRETKAPAEASDDAGSPFVYGGEPAEDASAPSDREPACEAGEQGCRGICVGAGDPIYGCGMPSCSPCDAAHATATCQANHCVIERCDPGFADCNRDLTDGCEVDLSRAKSCGACNRVCPPAKPLCTPTAAGFRCATMCSPVAPVLCGNECVSPLTSVDHCGGCNRKCPELAHANVACIAGNCGFSCKAGFSDCNMNAVDGCESRLSTDPLNCGACGRSCGGGTCTNGICSAPRQRH